MGQWQDALTTWRKFSDGTKAGTHHWFESRYKTARALFELGKKDRACDVLTMTLVLHPDLADRELKKRFLDLKSKSCEEGLKHVEKN